MTTLVSPGVAVREFDLTTAIQAVSASPGAMAGVFPWGPVEFRTLVDSEDTLVSTFGKPSNFNAETWFSGASFLSYTDTLWLVRAADTTGNTIAASYTGNSSNFVMAGGNNVMQLSNTTNLNVGMKLFFSNAAGLPIGATISAVNSTTVTLSGSASANVQSAAVVFRDDIALTAAALQSDLNYDGSDIADWDSLVVKNEDDYNSRVAAFDPASLYVARYPGDYGNSLRVSVCDSASQFKSNTSLTPNAQINATGTFLVGNVGSNTLTITVVPKDTSNSTNVTAANTLAGSVQATLAVNDLIELGNTKVGFQFLKITTVGNVTSSGNVFTVQLTTDDEVKLSSNVALGYVTRFWEFYRETETVPSQSNWQLLHGNTSANDELHVVVVDEGGAFTGSPGTVLETYKNVSRATDAKNDNGETNYYKNVINQKSAYIWWANDRTTAVSNTAEFLTSSTGVAPLDMRMIGGSNGPDESDVSVGTLALAWDMFASSEDVDVSLLIAGKAKGDPVSNKTQMANYILDNVAELRNPKDCVVFISPDYDDVVNNKGEEIYDVVDFRNNLRVTSYGVLDSGYKYMYDKYNDVNRWIPLNGDMAGLCARTDFTNDPWWSPAGLTRGQIKNVIRLSWNPRQAQRDFLYKNNVNPVISTQGNGTYLNGDKTLLTKSSAFDRINVRRLFIVLEKAIARASYFSLFEFNDDFTRAQFRNMVNPYLRDVQGRRGIYAFDVICDATNNTPAVIDSNSFVGDIYIKPARSINYITLNFVAVGTAVSFSEVVGKLGAGV
jgi:hypothetical protein